jgi:hypothetical protein
MWWPPTWQAVPLGAIIGTFLYFLTVHPDMNGVNPYWLGGIAGFFALLSLYISWTESPRTSQEPETGPWEPLHGCQPIAETVRTHPYGQHLAMSTRQEVAAVWDENTKRMSWNPNTDQALVSSLAWTVDGRKIVTVGSCYWDKTIRSSSAFSIYDWPSTQVLGRCRLRWPRGLGYWHRVTVSPTQPLACIAWIDQTQGGLEWVAWRSEDGNAQPRQVCDNGFFSGDRFFDVAFSLNGRYAIASGGIECWWSDEDWTVPCAGGDMLIGRVLVTDTYSWEYRLINVTAEVPRGWLPDDVDDHGACEIIAEFDDNERFTVSLPTGQTRTFRVSDGQRHESQPRLYG